MEILKPEVPIVNRFLKLPQYEGSVDSFAGIPIHLDRFDWEFESEGEARTIPVFSIWNYDDHAEIARMIAEGKAAAMYMWGTYGTGMLLNSPQWQRNGQQESEKLRTQLKKDRPWGNKFANFMYPDDMIDFWDVDRFHPNYRHLQRATKRWQLYDAGPVHIIAPTKVRNPHLDESLLQKEDMTASYFYMPHPGWNRVVELLRKEVKHAVFGGGSLNFHKEEPGFTTETLYRMICQKPEWQENIDLVVVDEISESAKVNRSQTQIRIPEKGTDGVCQVVRVGGVDPKTWSMVTGYPVKDAPEGVKFASSQTDYNSTTNRLIDDRIGHSQDLMAEYHHMVRRK